MIVREDSHPQILGIETTLVGTAFLGRQAARGGTFTPQLITLLHP